MPGIATGIPGAKAFDELYEQTQSVKFRNGNDGKPPDNKIVVEPNPKNATEFRASVLEALGVGKNVTGQA